MGSLSWRPHLRAALRAACGCALQAGARKVAMRNSSKDVVNNAVDIFGQARYNPNIVFEYMMSLTIVLNPV